MIKSAKFENLQLHKSIHLKDLANINVILGKNNTGKTSLLKMMYATTKALEKCSRQKLDFASALSEKIIGTFLTQNNELKLGTLVKKGAKNKFSAAFEFNHTALEYQQNLNFSFGNENKGNIQDHNYSQDISADFNCLFLPTRELLSGLDLISYSRRNFHFNYFDDTYLDLVDALQVPNQPTDNFRKFNTQLERIINGKIIQKKSDTSSLEFVYKKGNAEYAMPLAAEGVKKIGILSPLIQNRQLTTNSCFFVDEPENNLHPNATREFVNLLTEMAKTGTQIFISTHSYFVLKQLALNAQKYQMDIPCFSLIEQENEIECQSYNLKLGLPDNPILAESVALYDEEIDLEFNTATRKRYEK